MCLSEGTMRTHVSRILVKLGLRERARIVVVADETVLSAEMCTDCSGDTGVPRV
ncbi:hypothetical protein [Nonomuraea sp. LPB2021202275-12-8]|uniref:hypothetical protein n=1 Tax=Nonomuraea sp. LPB2021202275-12-8 TaxID=3120159 RepID=UPI003FA5EF22